MIKLTLVLLLLLAFCHSRKISLVTGDIFKNKTEWEQPAPAINETVLIQTQKSAVRRYLAGDVTFESCPGPHNDIYDIDDDYSHTEPDKAAKNIDVTLILEGVMNEDEHVDQLHLDVYWNGNLFHSEDHPLNDDVEEQEPYELQFSWFVPGFAPSGAYLVDLIVRSAGTELGCERVSFAL